MKKHYLIFKTLLFIILKIVLIVCVHVFLIYTEHKRLWRQFEFFVIKSNTSKIYTIFNDVLCQQKVFFYFSGKNQVCLTFFNNPIAKTSSNLQIYIILEGLQRKTNVRNWIIIFTNGACLGPDVCGYLRFVYM